MIRFEIKIDNWHVSRLILKRLILDRPTSGRRSDSSFDMSRVSSYWFWSFDGRRKGLSLLCWLWVVDKWLLAWSTPQSTSWRNAFVDSGWYAPQSVIKVWAAFVYSFKILLFFRFIALVSRWTSLFSCFASQCPSRRVTN